MSEEEIAKLEMDNFVLAEENRKLQKENEKLKEENFDQVYMKAIADYKEKIRNKIKELEKEYNNCKKGDTFKKAKLLYQIAILKELLGE